MQYKNFLYKKEQCPNPTSIVQAHGGMRLIGIEKEIDYLYKNVFRKYQFLNPESSSVSWQIYDQIVITTNGLHSGVDISDFSLIRNVDKNHVIYNGISDPDPMFPIHYYFHKEILNSYSRYECPAKTECILFIGVTVAPQNIPVFHNKVLEESSIQEGTKKIWTEICKRQDRIACVEGVGILIVGESLLHCIKKVRKIIFS